MKALVGAFNKEMAFVGAFKRHCETSRRLVDSSTTHSAVDGGIKAGIYCTLEEKKLLHAIMLALEF